MDRRLELHDMLSGCLGSDKVYFQPPETVKLEYPCIIYNRASNDTRFADNYPYHIVRKYKIIVIDRDPDTEVPDRVSLLPMCRMTSTSTIDNLNHYYFDIFY